MRLIIYILKQRVQHLLVWNNAPPHIRRLSPITVATVCRLPTRAADWQRKMTNDSCQVKCGCKPYMICALAWVSQLCSYIVGLQSLYLKFLFCFILCLQKLLLCVTLSSSSSRLSYRLRPDLLSTLFLSTLSPISNANKRPTAVSLFTLQYKYHTALFCISFR